MEMLLIRHSGSGGSGDLLSILNLNDTFLMSSVELWNSPSSLNILSFQMSAGRFVWLLYDTDEIWPAVKILPFQNEV